jgi:hypothetical protein
VVKERPSAVLLLGGFNDLDCTGGAVPDDDDVLADVLRGDVDAVVGGVFRQREP